jgi:hypothetical protein
MDAWSARSQMSRSQAISPATIELDGLTNQILIIAAVALLVSTLLGFARGVPWETLFVNGIAFAAR